jgi:hypothetical protein
MIALQEVGPTFHTVARMFINKMPYAAMMRPESCLQIIALYEDARREECR